MVHMGLFANRVAYSSPILTDWSIIIFPYMFPPLGGIPYSSDTPIPPELDDGKIQRKPAEFLNFPLNYLELNLDMGFGGSLIEDILTIF